METIDLNNVLEQLRKEKEVNKKLKKEISLLEKENKSYGLHWDKSFQPEGAVLEMNDNIPVMENIKELNIINNEDDDYNMLIEGDNLHSLISLQKDFRGKIDVIEIDPPYNTGSESFIYSDNFGVKKSDSVPMEDGRRHTKWLNFMDRRLRLAKELLSDNGVVFIHIDDNECFQLKLLCDSIFGECSFVGNMVWKCSSGSNDVKTIKGVHEYVLIYCKDIKKCRFNNIALSQEHIDKSYKNPDNDPNGKYMTVQTFRNDGRREYDFFAPNGTKHTKGWLHTPENMEAMKEKGQLWFGNDGNSIPRKKVYLSESAGSKANSLISAEQSGSNSISTALLVELFGRTNVFNYSKPVDLIKHLVKIASNKDSIVLDFFAGSGTTGQAVLELNKEDNGTRKFILCTNNENNICRDVTYPRLSKIINGYTGAKSGKIFNGMGGNLKYNIVRNVPFNYDIQYRNNIDKELTDILISNIVIGLDKYETGVSEFDVYRNADGSKSYYFINDDEIILRDDEGKIYNDNTSDLLRDYGVIYDKNRSIFKFYKMFLEDKASDKKIFVNELRVKNLLDSFYLNDNMRKELGNTYSKSIDDIAKCYDYGLTDFSLSYVKSVINAIKIQANGREL